MLPIMRVWNRTVDDYFALLKSSDLSIPDESHRIEPVASPAKDYIKARKNALLSSMVLNLSRDLQAIRSDNASREMRNGGEIS